MAQIEMHILFHIFPPEPFLSLTWIIQKDGYYFILVFAFAYTCSWCVHTVWDTAAYWLAILAAYLLLAVMDSLRRTGRDHHPAAFHPHPHSPMARWEVRLEHGKTHSHINGWLLQPLLALLAVAWVKHFRPHYSHSDGLNTSLLLFITLCFIGHFFFFFLRATSVAQAVLICVCLAMKVILILIADCNTSLDTEYTYMHTNTAVKKFHFEYLIERILFLFFFSNIWLQSKTKVKT